MVIQSIIDRLKSVGGMGAQAEQTYEPKQDEGEICSKYDKMIEMSARLRAEHEKQWFYNIAFVLGHHYINWNDFTKKFDTANRSRKRIKETVNEILIRYRKALSKMVGNDPKAVVTPNSEEDDDLDAAKLGTKVLLGLKRKLKMRLKMLKKSQWQLLCGSVFLHPYWNPRLGDALPPLGSESTIEAITGGGTLEAPEVSLAVPEAQEESLNAEAYTGDVAIDVFNAFECYPIGYAGDMDSTRGMAVCKYVSLDVLKQLYPDRGHLVKAESNTSVSEEYLNKIESLGLDQNQRDKKDDTDEKAVYKRVWLRPTKERPNGTYIAYANNIILAAEQDVPDIELGKGEEINPFELPFLKYDDIMIPGRFWSQTVIEQQIPVNKTLNRIDSHISRNIRKMANPKWVTPEGSITKGSLTDDTGEVVEYKVFPDKLPGKPEMIQPSGLPNYIFMYRSSIKLTLADIGSNHDVDRAQAPTGVTSGRAIAELKDSDNADMGPSNIQETENRIILYSMLLKLVQKNYKEERLLPIMGNNKQSEVVAFIGADLKNNTDVWIEPDDIVPSDRVGRQQFILNLKKEGLLGNPGSDETRKRTLRMLEVGNTDEIWDEPSIDAKEARLENKGMMEGMEQQPMAWQNHIAHILEHLKLMKSLSYKKLHPLIREIFERHIIETQDLMGFQSPRGTAEVNPPIPEGVQ